ncbi:MAG: hypothetical protein NTW87_14960 [Planctomycetota bacterium]|nr:hypothetical protein [Planctomycetota bacterium]
MRRIVLTLTALSVLCAPLCLAAGEEKAATPTVKAPAPAWPVPVPAKAEDEPWKAEIAKKLERKVTFEFVDTPLEEALSFLRTLVAVNLILDPRAVVEHRNTMPVTLRVQDMGVGLALQWVCKLADLKYELRENAIFVTFADDGKAGEAKAPVLPPGSKLRVKLPNGSEMEADVAVFSQRPDLLEDVVNRFLDLPQHRVVPIPLGGANVDHDALARLLNGLGGRDVTVEHNRDLQLLVLRSKNPRALMDLVMVANVALQHPPEHHNAPKPPHAPEKPAPPEKQAPAAKPPAPPHDPAF